MYQCFQPFSDVAKKVLDFRRGLWYLCLLTKEAKQMYDYMRTLQKHFEPQPEFFQNLDRDIRQIHKQLSARLEAEGRKLLLKLIDMEDPAQRSQTPQLHQRITGLSSRAGRSWHK